MPFVRCSLLAAAALLSLPSRAVDPGQSAPALFGRSLLDDHKYSLADFKGKVLIVDFWASWCGPCIASMPDLEGLRKRLIGLGYGEQFEILGVNVDEDRERALAFLKVHPVSYPIIADVLGLGMRDFAPRKLPSTYVIGKTGRVEFIYYGYGQGYAADLELKALEQLGKNPKK